MGNMGNAKRRVEKLEGMRQKRASAPGSGYPPSKTLSVYEKGSCLAFWSMEIERAAFTLTRAGEPRLTLNADDTFVSPGDGFLLVSRDQIDFPRLWRLDDDEEPDPAPWRRFLTADDVAQENLQRIFELAEASTVPDGYEMAMFSGAYTFEEADESADRALAKLSIFVDDEERERVRRLSWTLLHNPDARALLSEITTRRDAFVKEEGAG
jgi:hypothetical protein